MAVSSNMLRSAYVQLTRLISKQCLKSVSRCDLCSSYPRFCPSAQNKLCIRAISSTQNVSTSLKTELSQELEWTTLGASCAKDILSKVEEKLASKDIGRLFAVVHVNGKQRKVTTEDIIILEHDFPPTVGDRIRLEKVLMVGGTDFTLVGRPMLSRDQVYIDATVVEKTLSHYKTIFNFIKRKRHTRFILERISHTMLVINNIRILKPLP